MPDSARWNTFFALMHPPIIAESLDKGYIDYLVDLSHYLIKGSYDQARTLLVCMQVIQGLEDMNDILKFLQAVKNEDIIIEPSDTKINIYQIPDYDFGAVFGLQRPEEAVVTMIITHLNNKDAQ